MEGKEGQTISIVIAEPLDIVRAGFRALLQNESSFVVVGETGDAKALTSSVATLSPDILVLEPSLASRSPDQALTEIRKAHPTTKIVLLADPEKLSAAVSLLEQGADGCFLKNDKPEEFLRGISAVTAGEPTVSSSVTRWLLKRLAGNERTLSTQALTEREREIIELLIAGLSNKEIAQKLYLSVRTVEVHLRNIYAKLGVRSRLEAVTHFLRRNPD